MNNNGLGAELEFPWSLLGNLDRLDFGLEGNWPADVQDIAHPGKHAYAFRYGLYAVPTGLTRSHSFGSNECFPLGPGLTSQERKYPMAGRVHPKVLTPSVQVADSSVGDDYDEIFFGSYGITSGTLRQRHSAG